MKRRAHFVLLALLAVAAAAVSLATAVVAVAHHDGPAVGQLPPPLDLPLIKGRSPRFSLADARGAPLVVEVFASWCGACESAAPALAAAALAPRRQAVRVIGVSVDDDPFLAAVAAGRWGIPYDVAFDDVGAADSWNVRSLPALIVVDADGRVVRVATGAPDPGTLERWLSEVGASRVD
jgi:thiol-disulfide isomerase/thioredoxin